MKLPRKVEEGVTALGYTSASTGVSAGLRHSLPSRGCAGSGCLRLAQGMKDQ